MDRDQASDSAVIGVHHGTLVELADDWDGLLDASHPGAPFRSYAWIAAWWRRFRGSREARLLTAHRGRELVGLLPLYRERAALGTQRWRLMGDEHVGSDYLGPVCRRADEGAVLTGLARFLGATGEELQLDDLEADDPTLAALRREAGRHELTTEVRFPCPRVAIGGAFDTYLEARPEGVGAQWHRRYRWLQRQPGFRLRVETAVDRLPAAMQSLFELHQARWALEGGSDGISGPAIEEFHRQSSLELARRQGWPVVYLLEVQGAPRAALYGFRHGSRFAYYQSGHDPEWRPRAVGTVLLGLVIRDCFQRGLVEFDFLRGLESYKLKWANAERQTVRLRACPSGWRSRIGETGRRVDVSLREAGKKLLPPATLSWLRTQRQRWARISR